VRDPDGAIASIVYRGVSCKVEDSVGPERIESGWWSGPTHRRDYFRIILETGDWWWIYRDLRSGVWYLHGAMD
jgi:protein ImuB